MKKSVITVLLLIGAITLININNIFAQCDAWTQKTNFGGVTRYYSVGFSINNKGYIGTGRDAGGALQDFWEYDPVLDTWTQKANYGAGISNGAVFGFTGSYRNIRTGISGFVPASFR